MIQNVKVNAKVQVENNTATPRTKEVADMDTPTYFKDQSHKDYIRGKGGKMRRVEPSAGINVKFCFSLF